MVDQELLELIVCPETKQRLRLADTDLLALLNGAISAGGVANRGGTPVTETVPEGLVRGDGLFL